MKFFALSFLSLCMFTFHTNAESLAVQIRPSQRKRSDPILLLKNINRSFDGTGNNIKYPKWGSTNSDIERFCAPNYSDGVDKMWEQKPNVRQVSNLVASIDEDEQLPIDENGINLLLPIYGQFVDHDIGMAPNGKTEPVPIKIPMCDPKFDPDCKGNVEMPFSRASFNAQKKVRTNVNALTAWMDGSQVYGPSKDASDKLRTFCDGKIKTSPGQMLFKDEKGNYVSGDFRVNQNIGLTSIHTVFARQHNSLCDRLKKSYPQLTDNELYTIARNYVIGLIQHITYDEYLPLLLGKKNFEKLVGCYQYMPNMSPNLYAEFSGAGYRLHSLVWAPFTLNDDKGKILKTLTVGESYGNAGLVTPQLIDEIFNGLLNNPMKQRTIQLNDQLRNSLLFGPPGGQSIDLFSINVQRGRDMGIGSIPCLRQMLGLSQQSTFEQNFQGEQKAKIIQKLYHKIQNVDLYLGILGQKLVKGAVLGQIGIKLNAFQFRKIRNGDRFWYEYAYPEEIVKQIKKTSFADILQRSAGVRSVGNNAFKRV